MRKEDSASYKYFNVSNEVIRVAGFPGQFNNETGRYEPYYTRPANQDFSEHVYKDTVWRKQAELFYNQPNNVRSVLITPMYILVIFYKPVNYIKSDGQTGSRLFNIEPYTGKLKQLLDTKLQGAGNSIKIEAVKILDWLVQPRIYSNIEEIVIDRRVLKLSGFGAEKLKELKTQLQEILENHKDSGFKRLNKVAFQGDIELDIKSLLGQASIIKTLQTNNISYASIYQADKADNQLGLVSRPEYYRYDLEVLAQAQRKLEQTQKKSELEHLIEEYTAKFGSETAAKMVQVAVKEAVNQVGDQIYTPQQIKLKLLDEMQIDGHIKYKNYLA